MYPSLSPSYGVIGGCFLSFVLFSGSHSTKQPKDHLHLHLNCYFCKVPFLFHTKAIGTTFRFNFGSKRSFPILLRFVSSIPQTVSFEFVLIRSWIFLNRPAMVIVAKHPHCDLQGLIYHPYISVWSPTNKLCTLIAQLCAVFSESPPVGCLVGFLLFDHNFRFV